MGAKQVKAIEEAVAAPKNRDAARKAFDAQDTTKDHRLGKKEFRAMTSTILEKDGGFTQMKKKDKDKAIEKFVDETFTKAGGKPSLEFHEFMNQLSGPQPTQAQGAAAPQMNTHVMNFYLNYTARDKEGNLVVCNLPKDWIELFKKANVKPKELKDPDTVIFLLDLMDKHAAQQRGGAPAAPGGRAAAPTPGGGGPPPPPSANGGPPPPPPPPGPGPPPPPSTKLASPSATSGGGGGGGGGGNVFDEIRAGKQLKKAEDRQLVDEVKASENDLVGMMSSAMAARRAAISKDAGDDDDDDDGDWDDWE